MNTHRVPRNGYQAGVGGGIVTRLPTDQLCPVLSLSGIAPPTPARRCVADLTSKPVHPLVVRLITVLSPRFPFRCANTRHEERRRIVLAGIVEHMIGMQPRPGPGNYVGGEGDDR